MFALNNRKSDQTWANDGVCVLIKFNMPRTLRKHTDKNTYVTDRRQPVALRRTWEEWRCSLRSSCVWGEVSHPEWGMMTALVNTARASWMIGIFRASHEDRFHKTPTEEVGGENKHY